MKKIPPKSANARYFLLGSILALSILYTLGTGVYYSWGIIYRPVISDTDYISTWESRFTDLKKQIPAGEKNVGYVSDWDMTGYDKDAYIEFALTQYTLAPLFVKRDLNHEWIIANSKNKGFLDWLSQQINTPYMIKNYGNGIYLIHREVR
jgi:hypothetical protein